MRMSAIVRKPVPSAPRYLVGTDGSVLGPSGRILVPTVIPGGYRQVLVYPEGAPRRTARVHVLVCEAFHGPRPSQKHHAAHWDGNPANNAPENLRWASARESIADKVRHGRVTRTSGEVDGMAKLNSDQVREIRKRCKRGESQRSVAALFGVKQPTVSNIVTGKTWGHLDA